MPADPGAMGVLIDEGLNKVAAFQAEPHRKTGQQDLQEIRPWISATPAPLSGQSQSVEAIVEGRRRSPQRGQPRDGGY